MQKCYKQHFIICLISTVCLFLTSTCLLVGWISLHRRNRSLEREVKDQQLLLREAKKDALFAQDEAATKLQRLKDTGLGKQVYIEIDTLKKRIKELEAKPNSANQ